MGPCRCRVPAGDHGRLPVSSLLPDDPSDLRSALSEHYTLERQLGQGGMATVYLARDLKHDRYVALKVLRPELAATLGLERFQREIRVTARLQHPHILPVHDSGEAAGQLWYTMPFVDGESLRDRLDREKQLPVDEAVRIAREAALALEYAHQQGVIHRDIKPANLLLTRDGTTLVADFGIARLTRAGEGDLTESGLVVGTPLYMSPEQALGDRELDARSDIYALGAVLYEMLAGEPAFRGPTPHAVLARAITASPRPIHQLRDSVSPALDAIVARALARSPAERWPSMKDFAEALASGVMPRFTSRALLRRPLFGVLLLGIAIGGGALFAWRRSHGSAEVSAPRRLAVLALENKGGPDEAYLAEGIGDELRSSLTAVPGLVVKARGSSVHFTSGDANLKEVGTRLDVGTVLEASVRESGQRLLLVAELVKVADGNALWSHTFEAPRAAIAVVQDSIVRGIAAALGVPPGLVPEVIATREVRDTGDVEAYNLFLRGQHAIQQEDYERAIGFLKQAVTRNPRFARAHAALAYAYVQLPWQGKASLDSTLALSKISLARAVALDSTLPQIVTMRAAILETEFKFAKAETVAVAGLSAHPADPSLLAEYASILYDLGRMPEAVTQARNVQRLDPLDPPLALQYFLLLARDYRGAIDATRGVLELSPQNPVAWGNLAEAYVFLGRTDSAVIAAERSFQIDSSDYGTRQFLTFIYAAAGRWREAEVQRSLAARQIGINSPHLQRAQLHLAFNEFDSAAAEMEQSIEHLEPYLLFGGVPCDPIWDPLKTNPRFLKAVSRYWPHLCPASGRWPIAPRGGR